MPDKPCPQARRWQVEARDPGASIQPAPTPGKAWWRHLIDKVASHDTPTAPPVDLLWANMMLHAVPDPQAVIVATGSETSLAMAAHQALAKQPMHPGPLRQGERLLQREQHIHNALGQQCRGLQLVEQRGLRLQQPPGQRRASTCASP